LLSLDRRLDQMLVIGSLKVVVNLKDDGEGNKWDNVKQVA
jgi:hypothetical protein